MIKPFFFFIFFFKIVSIYSQVFADRYLVTNSAFLPKAKTITYNNTLLGFNQFHYGLNKNIAISTGFTAFPDYGDDFESWYLGPYASVKFGSKLSKFVSVSIKTEAYYSYVVHFYSIESNQHYFNNVNNTCITLGSNKANFTIGLNFIYRPGEQEEKLFFPYVNASTKFSDKVSFQIEQIYTDREKSITSAGFNFDYKKSSMSLGAVIFNNDDFLDIFPPILPQISLRFEIYKK